MSFVIVGGGPTGVELAGAISELARKALAADFRTIDPRRARIVLVEGGPRLLAAFPEPLSAFARDALQGMGVEVQVGRAVTGCDASGIVVSGEKLEAGTVLWAAGVAASPAARWLGAPADRAGRVLVQSNLSVPEHPQVFVIGDTAAVMQNGKPVPGIAPAAKQQGAYVAALIRGALRHGPLLPGFRYRHYGSLATIGRHSAVIDFGPVLLRGWFAWWIWGLAHIYFLIGARHRLLVASQWLFSYFTYGRGARLIVGSDAQERTRQG